MSAVEEYHNGVHAEDWSDVVCKRLADAAIAELEAELERVDCFPGHLAWLHEHYPETVFDGSSGDVGAVNVVLSRQLLQAEAERDALRAGMVRIIQCHNYAMQIPRAHPLGFATTSTVDGYNCADVLAVVHEVFPDFSAWDEARWQPREGGGG